MDSLKQLQEKAGALFGEPNPEIPLSFEQDTLALEALNNLQDNLMLVDRSDYGILVLTGEDRARFLHNQTTNDIQKLQVGQGCDTIFVNSTGRNIDLVTAYVQQEQILLMVSPQQSQTLYQWMDRYIFPFDKVNLQDKSEEYAIFTLVGEKSKDCLRSWVDNELLNGEEYTHQSIVLDDLEVTVAVGCSLKLAGYNLIMPKTKAPLIWQKLTEHQPILIGSQGWEKLRIYQGKPKPEQELTTEYNPLESGLWDAISFDKGCYIGQETIARLNTYKGVKQRLWGIKLNKSIDPQGDNIITVNEEKIGQVTSYLETEKEHFALGYIRTKAGGEGLHVNIGDAQGEVVAVPFIVHAYYEGEKNSES